MNLRALALLATLPLFGSCAVAALSAGVVIGSQEFTENASLAFLEETPEDVWSACKQTLERRSLDEIEIDEAEMALRANIDGSVVTAQVTRFDATQSKLAITARKWGFYDSDEANAVISLIKKELARR